MGKVKWKLDVLIPTFNRPKMLHHILATGLALNIPELRFVIIDDGSRQSEEIAGLGNLSAEEVCQSFNKLSIFYIKSTENKGLAENLVNYYKEHCAAEYTLLVNDKDEFIDGTSIVNAIKKLDNDPKISLVEIPLRQKDYEEQDRPLLFDYSRMSGSDFIKLYVKDNMLQHCGMYGVLRVSAIKAAGVPRPLNLRAYGLEDAFGFDIDFLFMVAATGDVEFEKLPHVRRSVVGGLTARYPLSFAYCYYQYAKRAMKELYKKKIIGRKDMTHYISWWHLLLLRGLIVVYQPSPQRDEIDTSRIRAHLKIPVLFYYAIQCIQYRVWPSSEMKSLLHMQYIKNKWPFIKKIV